MTPTSISSDDGLALIDLLRGMEGGMDYSGDASSQVIFKLANGRTLRFGVTDDDVAEHPGLWIDQYGGLTGAEVRFFADGRPPRYTPYRIAEEDMDEGGPSPWAMLVRERDDLKAAIAALDKWVDDRAGAG